MVADRIYTGWYRCAVCAREWQGYAIPHQPEQDDCPRCGNPQHPYDFDVEEGGEE